MPNAIEPVITSTSSTVQVSGALGSAGVALTATPSASVEISVPPNSAPVAYKVGADAWRVLDGGQGVSLPINLSLTTVLVRKASTVAGSVPLRMTVNLLTQTRTGSGDLVAEPIVFVGTTAPSNADGRPDGTIYIQTA